MPAAAKQATPMLCIPKKNGTLRTIFDLRQQNENTWKDVTPFPDQDAICHDIARATFRSKLDMTEAYEQMHIRTEDVGKTTFSTIFGMFQSRVMQMGDCNAPTLERHSQYWESMDWARERSLWRVSGLPTRAISSLMRDRSLQYICQWRAVSPHWTWAARQLKLTRYFTMHWLSCILRFSRSASALPSGSWGPKLFFNSLMKSE